MSISRFPVYFAVLFSTLVALMSWRFLVLGVEASMEVMLYHAQQRPVQFFAHVLLGPLALLLTLLQLWVWLRVSHPVLHRWLGRAYALCVAIAGVGGLFLAINTNAGPVAGWGFGLLAVAWIGTTARGVWLARARRFKEHRHWMIRSAALTFAGVTLRIYLPIAIVSDMPFQTAYVAIAWLCWVPNVLVAEWWLRRNP